MGHIVAWLHLLCFASAFAMLAVERDHVRAMRRGEGVRLRLVAAVDGIYGLSALGSIVTGLLRVFVYEKPASYYWHNPLFHAKLALLIAAGLLSVYPTLFYLRNYKKEAPADFHVRHAAPLTRIEMIIAAELFLYASAPLLAVAVARGAGG